MNEEALAQIKEKKNDMAHTKLTEQVLRLSFFRSLGTDSRLETNLKCVLLPSEAVITSNTATQNCKIGLPQ